MEPALHYTDDKVTLWHADCRDILAALPDASVDAVVTDPPYELTSKSGGGGFMGKRWDATGVAFDVAVWAECLRVLKPGGHLLAFGGTRTWHRLAVAIEDAGFEIRDSIAWIFGSGFPKNLDVSKAIDKAAGATREVIGEGQVFGRGARGNRARVEAGYRSAEVAPDGGVALVTAPATADAARWAGWGTALKPAHEPICVARKPLAGTVAGNVVEYGTGALNIDGCRVEATEALVRPQIQRTDNDVLGKGLGVGVQVEPSGRWPANVVLDEHQAATLDRQSGTLTSGANPTRRSSDKFGDAYGEFAGATDCVPARGADTGGASRFFYVAKAPTDERPRHDGIAHPTVKPLDLMRWLVRLVTPPGGTVLEPFAGSGTTVEACLLEGFRCIAVEREAEYLPLIVDRVTKRTDPVAHLVHRVEGGADVDLGLFGLLAE